MEPTKINYFTNQSINDFTNITGIPDSVIDAAKAKLIDCLQKNFPDFDIDRDPIVLENFKHVIWPNSALGCPEEGHCYLEVLTPGYEVGFRIGNQHYKMHTDAVGLAIVSPDFRSQ